MRHIFIRLLLALIWIVVAGVNLVMGNVGMAGLFGIVGIVYFTTAISMKKEKEAK